MVRPPLVWKLVGLRRLTRATLGALIAATAVAAFVLWHEVVRDLEPFRTDIPWWALAAGFAFTEVFVVHAHVRGSAHSLSLSELPLVLGLLLADPDALMLGMVVGPGVVLVATRQDPVRLFFNLAQFALTAAVASITLHALLPVAVEIGPAAWLAVFVAVIHASIAASVLVFCAIGLAEGGIPSRRLAGMLGADLVVALTNASVALAGATVVVNDTRAAWLLLPPAAMLLLAYRAYISEQAKHRSLEFLYGVTRSLSRGGASWRPSCWTSCAARARASGYRPPSSCSCPRSARCAPRAGRTARRSWCRCRGLTSPRCGARSRPTTRCWSRATAAVGSATTSRAGGSRRR